MINEGEIGTCLDSGYFTVCGSTSQESCNGVDDDCDGTVDEDPVGLCDDGNVCNGTDTCQAGTCVVGTPPSCDDDNLCTVDSCDSADGCEHAPVVCDPGEACDPADGQCKPTCTPTGDDTDCDGLDDDCDGTADDGYVPTATSCGTGVCGSTGQLVCVGGSTQNTCVIGSPTGDDTDCDGLDNDCDGTADDGYVPTATTCGVGECASTGQLTCVGGAEQDSCL